MYRSSLIALYLIIYLLFGFHKFISWKIKKEFGKLGEKKLNFFQSIKEDKGLKEENYADSNIIYSPVHEHQQCREMFDIGWPKGNKNYFNQETSLGWGFRDLLKAKEKQIQTTQHYLLLANILPNIIEGSSRHLYIKNETRLMILKGKLPYLRCAIKMYKPEDIKSCISSRHANNKSFWIAFFGDSKMRKMFQQMAITTNAISNWKFTSENESIIHSLDDLKDDMKNKLYINREAWSEVGTKLTYKCSRFGIPDQQLEKWVQSRGKEKLPDVLFIEFGAWWATTYRLHNLLAEDWSIFIWFRLRQLILKLTQTITVIVVSHSRLRTPPNTLFHFRKNSRPESKLKLYALQDQQIDILDIIMNNAIKNTDIVLWDSTLPLNLASREDCRKIREAKLSGFWDLMNVNKEVESRFSCYDDIHRSTPTMEDETTIILNFMCNKFVTNISAANLCCCGS